jgi:hypothetical protein
MVGSKQLSGMLILSLLIGLVAGLTLAGFGVWLVTLNAQGTAKLSLLGQTMDSNNVGVTAIFIGAVTLIFVVHRTLKSLDLISVSGVTAAVNQPQAAAMPTLVELTVDDLKEKLRKISREQRQLLALIYRSKDGVHVVDAQDALSLTRGEAVYRARDLAAAGLVEILVQTDQCFVLSDALRRLNETQRAAVGRAVTAGL